MSSGAYPFLYSTTIWLTVMRVPSMRRRPPQISGELTKKVFIAVLIISVTQGRADEVLSTREKGVKSILFSAHSYKSPLAYPNVIAILAYFNVESRSVRFKDKILIDFRVTTFPVNVNA